LELNFLQLRNKKISFLSKHPALHKLKNQNLLKYLTHLTFSEFENFHLFGSQIKCLLDSCSSLASLSFPINTDFHKNSHTLAPLQSESFQNITNLHLQVYDIWSFIEAFSFSSALEKLTLNCCYRSSWYKIWSMLYPIGLAHKDTPKYREILLNFFEKFKQLSQLKSLGIYLPKFDHPDEIMVGFILPLLQAVPKLASFKCRLSHDSAPCETPFDLSIFLDGISSLKSLKSFKITHHQKVISEIMADDLAITFNPIQAYHFPNMTSVYLSTWLQEDFDFKNFFKMLLDNNTMKEIHLEKIYLTSVGSFLRLLKLLKEVGEGHQLWKIKLGITLSVGHLADIVKTIKYPIVPERNVEIDLDIYVASQKRFSLSPKGLKYMQGIFSHFQFDCSLLVPELSPYYPYREEKIELPLIRKNLPFSDSSSSI